MYIVPCDFHSVKQIRGDGAGVPIPGTIRKTVESQGCVDEIPIPENTVLGLFDIIQNIENTPGGAGVLHAITAAFDDVHGPLDVVGMILLTTSGENQGGDGRLFVEVSVCVGGED